MAMYDLEVKFSADSSKLTKAFKDADKGAKDVEKSATSLNNALDDSASGAFADSMNEAASSAAGAVAETEQLNSALSDTAVQAESAGSSVKRIAGAAIAIATVRKAAQELLECFQAYANYESSMIRVNDIFGDAADAVETFADNNAAALGMSKAAAYEYAATYGNLFRSITADQEENSRVTMAMLTASASIASKTGRTVSDVMERIRSGLLGNTEAIEDLGIFVNVAMLETTDAFKRMADGRSWDQLEYYEQQQIRTLAILEQAHKQFGGEITQNTATSMAAFQASVEDLKVSVGQLAAGALAPAVQALTYLARSALGCVAWFRSLDGVSKSYLKVALLLGVAIPTVTLATKALALAQAGVHAIQALLIPQTLTYATALKALLGWVALAAAAFGILHSIFSKNKDTEDAADSVDDYNKSIEQAQKNANNAANSIGDMTAATKELTDEVKRSLASFDEINRLNGNNSIIGVDNESIDKAAESLSAFNDLDYDINYDTNVEDVSTRISKSLKGIWTDVKAGYSDWKSFWDQAGKNMKKGIQNGNWTPLLEQFNGVVRTVFGDKWTDFWEDVGEDMYTGIEDGDWVPLLEDFNNIVERIFGKRWTDWWEKTGENMYEGIENGNWTPLLEQYNGLVEKVFGDQWTSFWETVGGHMYEGIENGDWEPFLNDINEGIKVVFGEGWTNYWEKVGEHMHKGIEGGDWEPLLNDMNDNIRLLFGDDWSDFWEGVGEAMYDKLSYWSDKISGAFSGVKNWFKETFDIGIDDEDELALGGTAAATQPFLELRSDKVFGNLLTASLLSRALYGHAQGAIVTKPEIAMIGESGAEAVIPLENNTGWIDMLAGKIAALIPTTSGGDGYAPIILDGREVGRFCIKAVEDNNRRKGG